MKNATNTSDDAKSNKWRNVAERKKDEGAETCGGDTQETMDNNRWACTRGTTKKPLVGTRIDATKNRTTRQKTSLTEITELPPSRG
jgi:hypothetical protein